MGKVQLMEVQEFGRPIYIGVVTDEVVDGWIGPRGDENQLFIRHLFDAQARAEGGLISERDFHHAFHHRAGQAGGHAKFTANRQVGKLGAQRVDPAKAKPGPEGRLRADGQRAGETFGDGDVLAGLFPVAQKELREGFKFGPRPGELRTRLGADEKRAAQLVL